MLKNDDPLIATPYNVLYFQADAEAKRFSAELKNALITLNKMKIEPPPISMTDLKRLQKKYRNKTDRKKTIVFDLEDTLIKAVYRKHQLMYKDGQALVPFIGNKKIKVRSGGS